MIAHLFTSLMPVVALFATVTLLVLRAGASRIFFDVVGSFQATRLIGDAQAKITVLQGLVLDGLSGITEGVGLIGEQMQNLVDSTVPLSQEIASARIEFEKFANFAESQDVANEIIAIGESYAFSADQALSAGAKMAQLSQIVGGGEATVTATEVGIQFGLVGGMETEDAMKKIISLQQQTGFMYGDLTKKQFDRLSAQEKANLVGYESVKMLNQLNTIENRSSATMAQITHVMNQFASSAKLAGDETSFMAAASATLIEAGEEQGKAGRALKMIYARLGADTGKNSEILRNFGVETKNANGSLRSLEEILTDLSTIYPHLSNEQQLQISQAMAGNDHYVRAIKLMEGFNRTTQLQTDAVNELDTAQDELNKRMQDNSFLLTQQEARLKNAKAQVGDIFTPAVIRATKAQADLNFALSDMAESSDALKGIIEVMFSFQQFGKMYAPLVEANLNLMSLTVSLQTQMQIQRALAGQDIVRASAYGGQGAQLRANLNTISQIGQKQSENAMIAAMNLKVESNDLEVARAKLRVTSGEVTNNRQALLSSQESVRSEIKHLQIKENEFKLTQALNNAEATSRIAEKSSLQIQLDNNQAKQKELQMLTLEDSLRNTANQYDRYKNVSIERLLQYKKGHFVVVKATNDMEKNNALVKQQQAELQRNEIVNELALSQINTGLDKQEQKSLAAKQQELKLIQNQLALEGERLMFAALSGQSIQQNVIGHSILEAAYHKVGNAVAQTSNVETQNNLIMAAAEQAAKELAIAFGLDEAALAGVIMKLPQFQAGLGAVSAQSDKVVKSTMGMNMGLMKTTGILGGASMALSMFSDNEKAARASMILMNLSMIPMTIQMVSATKASFGLMGGMQGAGVAANFLTINVRAATAAFMTFAKATVVVGAIAYLAYKLMPDFTSSTDDMTSSLNDLNSSLSYTEDQYKAISSAAESYNDLELSQAKSDAKTNMLEAEEDMENSKDARLRQHHENRMKEYAAEYGVLSDLLTIKTAENLLGGEEGSSYFDSVKTAQQLRKDSEEYEKNTKTIAGRIRDIGTQATEGFFGAMDLIPLVNLQESHLSAREEGALMDAAATTAFANLDKNAQGAIEELALASKTQEEFQAGLKKLIADDTLGGAFAPFADDVEENFIGPIEAAKEAAFEFSNAREEMFFGMSKGNITGDMVKQVVNKGVETLINTTEVIMTNNFTGMTTTQAANEITKQVVENLNGLGLNILNA